MASRNEHRQKKKAEKRRLEAKADQKARRVRAQAAAKSETATGAAWSVGRAWASEGWHEQGAQVQAVFTRRRPDGHSSVAMFEVDLAERGVVSVKLLSNVSDDRLLGEVGRRSADKAMMEVEPDLVARLVREARIWGESQGHAQPRDLNDAFELMGDVDGSDWTDPIKVGRDPKKAPLADPGSGLGARFKRWFFGDPIVR